ncbi:ATP-binding cassette domain-containing protein [Janibacter sp. Soil728]|uniref:ATP-binding cassette domain-containing protein n=1 Tax=Janibacter sp. Soil728 TaxID=1736393 RepID=UPI0009EC400A|nr:ATP-binding cassette domain-containing protein [Janibacter sp. Soil728]
MVDPQHPDATAAKTRTPTVVVSHVSVTYRVLGGERRGAPSTQGEPRSFRQMLRGGGERTREIHAVQDVSFVAHHGESIGIIGHNGSGKSTLLRAVAGLLPPSEGRLWVSGEPSLLGVNAVLIRKLSGTRNIYVGGQALGLSKAEIDEKFDEIVDFSGIGDAVHLPMSTYSSGMGARLRFAISTAATPDVLMIDEALATGDAAFRKKSAERIKAIREAAGTVFLVSHSNSNIREICDRVLWMDHGRLLMDGPTEEVLPAYEATLPKTKARTKDAAPVEPDVPGTVRWTGRNRTDVAREITQDAWDPGVAGCFVVSSQGIATARMVAPIAAQLGWPLLWVRPGALPAATRDELGRLAPEHIVVVGDDDDITPRAYSHIDKLAVGTIERVAADDLALTAARLLQSFPPKDGSTMYVTRADNSATTAATSLKAAATHRSVIVCDTADVPDELAAAVASVGPRRLVFVGYEEEWSTETVARLREATGADVEFFREEGPMAVVAGLWDQVQPGGRAIVCGPSVLELLTAAVASGHHGTPVLLVTTARLPQVVRSTLERLAPTQIVLCGVVDALPPDLRQDLGQLVR